MKLLKKMINAKGLSLTEMMVGVAIMGGLSLVVMNLAQQGVRTGNQINKEAEINDFQSYVAKSFENPEFCDSSLSTPSTTTLSSISGTNQRQLTNIFNNNKNITGQYIFVSGNAASNTRNGVTLNKAYIEKYNANLKTADLITEYTYKLDAKQTKPIVNRKRLTIGITPDTTNTQVDTCYLKSTGIDLLGPKVVIEQDSTQVDPSMALPIKFVIGFDEPIDPTTFTTVDITNTGTATGVTWSLSSTDNTTWYLQATAVTTGGTLIPSLAASVVKDRAGNYNEASTSKDNIVTYIPPTVVWLKDPPYPPMPDNFENAICNTVHVYTLKNTGTATTGTIATSLSSATNFIIGTDNCNTKTLAAGATCTVEVKFLASTISAGTYATDLSASVGGGPSVVFSITGTKVTTDPCASSPTPGTICSGCKSVFAGSSSGIYYMTTKGGCTNSTAPTCSGSLDNLIKLWAPSSNLTLEGATSLSDGEANTTTLAAKTYTELAKFCADMVYDGHSDWYLPALNEMSYLYNARDLIGGFNLTTGYQTSTEYNSGNFRGYSISGGYGYINYKNYYGSSFRCIRKYDSTDPCQAASAPTAGTSCNGGAKYLGALTVGGVTNKYMTTPGGCTDSPDNTSQFTPTCSDGTDIVTKSWGPSTYYDTTLPNISTSGPDTNSGDYNTNLLAASTTYIHAAARYCQNLNYGGFSDWFLPNMDELKLIHNARNSLGGVVLDRYWASTEIGSSMGADVTMGWGGSTGQMKDWIRLVRCVRKY